jgi:enoyl-CoA hydratase/carnithine racemase
MVRELVKYERDGHIGVVRLQRPEARNAISVGLFTELETEWEKFTLDKEAWVGILCGEGPSFSAGKDMKEHGTGKAMPLVRQFLNVSFVPDTDKPLIAAVQGHAVGVGWMMAAGCDLRIAEQSASFSYPGLAIGKLGPWSFGALENITWSTAFEIAVLGRTLTASRARELGLVNDVVPDGTALEAAYAMANELLQFPPEHTAATKALMREVRTHVSDEVARRAYVLGGELEDRHDTAEVRSAAREKRKPHFTWS